MRQTPQRRAVTATKGPVPARVVGTVVCAGIAGTVSKGSSTVSVGIAPVIFTDDAGPGLETWSSVVRVYTWPAWMDTFDTPESFRKNERVL